MTEVAVVGLGYVGLPTALSLADSGAKIIGYDVSEDRLADIKSGLVDLSTRDRQRLARHLQADTIILAAEPTMLAQAHAAVICVPTPIDAQQSPDLHALRCACADVVDNAVPGQTIVLTSTTYVGCTRELLARPLADRGLEVGKDVFVAFSPERIDPGVEAHSPDHTPRVLGGVTAACSLRAANVLKHTACTLHPVSSPEAAEMTKLLENTFRAVNIALANEFSDAAEEMGVNVVEVIDAAKTKPYGFMPFYPGPGVGGHCIPCDPHYLLWQLRKKHFDAPVTRSAMTAISLRPRAVVDRVLTTLGKQGIRPGCARVLISGVTYKPGVADLRESPALEIIEGLLDAGCRVGYVDPLMPAVPTRAGARLTPADPESSWDLVVLHTRHDGAMPSARSVVDMTYTGSS
jgi:nucleotide sugar dehydrogenase